MPINKTSICLGMPVYGSFSGAWATQTLGFVADLATKHTIDQVLAVGVMTADHNRNMIADEFLKTNSEWLFWIDSDTLIPLGAVDRMLSHGRTMVSGLYYGKNPPNPPIAYNIYNGAFRPLDQERNWEKGEIVEVDAVGFGCMLTHRSVFEDIKDTHKVFMEIGGGLRVVHNDDILGNVMASGEPQSHEHDGKVYRGQLRLRLQESTLQGGKFPFFMVEHARTEDMFFFDLARKAGHTPVLDTSVECGHLRLTPYTGADYRKEKGH